MILEAQTVYMLAALSLISGTIVPIMPTEKEEIERRFKLLLGDEDVAMDPDTYLAPVFREFTDSKEDKEYKKKWGGRWVTAWPFADKQCTLEANMHQTVEQYGRTKCSAKDTYDFLKDTDGFGLAKVEKYLWPTETMPF